MKKTLFILFLFLLVGSDYLEAQTLFAKGGTINWDLATNNWGTVQGTFSTTWVNGDIANISNGTGTITLTNSVSTSEILFGAATATAYTFAVGSPNILTLSSGTPTITVTASGTVKDEFDCQISAASNVAIGGVGLTLNIGSTSTVTTGAPLSNAGVPNQFNGGFSFSGVRINGNCPNAFGASGHAGTITVVNQNTIMSCVSTLADTMGNVVYNPIALNPGSSIARFAVALGATKGGAGSGNPQFLINYNGAISGNGTVFICNAAATGGGGGGATEFSSSSNTYTGRTIFGASNGGYFLCGANNCFPQTTAFVYGYGTNGYGLVDLNGMNVTVGSLEDSCTTANNLGIGNTSFSTSSQPFGTLTINGGGNSNATFGSNGALIGYITPGTTGNSIFPSYGFSHRIPNSNINVVMGSGAGTENFIGNNTYVGTTTCNGGTLNVANTNGTGIMSDVTINTGGSFFANNTVGSGIYAVNPASGTAVTVAGGTFGGKGTINGTIAVNSGTVSPGTTGSPVAGIITSTGAQTWTAGTYKLDIISASGTAGTAYDQVVATGTGAIALPSSGITLDVTGNPGGWAGAAETYTIMTAAGGISGFTSNTFTISLTNFTASNTAAYWNVTSDANNVYLNYTPPTPSLTVDPISLTGFLATPTSPSTSQSYTLTGANIVTTGTGSIYTGTSNYELSTDNSTFNTYLVGSPLTLSYNSGSTTITPSPIYVRLKTGLSVGPYSDVVTNTGGGAPNATVTLNGNVVVPTLIVTGPVVNFGNFGNVVVNQQTLADSFEVSGTNLTANPVVTAPTGFLVSLSLCSGYGSSVTLTETSGTLPRTPVYVKFAPTTVGGFGPVNITVTSTGATTANVSVRGGSITVAPTVFGIGNLIIYTVGDGCTQLSSAANPITLIDFSPSGGASGYTVAVPTSGANELTNSGVATYDGPISLSGDSTLLTFGGYNAPVGTLSITSSSNPRGIGMVNNAGTFSLLTSSSLFSAGNCRQAVTDGCSNFWACGAGTAGVAYFGDSGSVTPAYVASGTNQNTRGLVVANSKLYTSTGTGTPGIYTLNSEPFTAVASTLVITTGPTPAGFAFSPGAFVNGSVCYVCDNSASYTGNLQTSGGIQKYTYNGTSWSWTYTISPGLSSNGTGVATGAQWLTVDWSNLAHPTIYATTNDAVGGNTTNNRLISVVDNGSGSTATVLAMAGINQVFRGVAFSPKASPVAPTVQDNAIHFTPISGGSFTISWINGNGSHHLVKLLNNSNAFTPPVNGTQYTANTVFANVAGGEVVYTGTSNSVTITGLTAGQIYWAEVYGYNTAGSCETNVYDTVSTAQDNPIPNVFVWNGITSTNWSVASNWNSNSVPNSNSANVYIQFGTPNSPALTASVTVNDFFMEDATSLNLGTFNLTSFGNWLGGSSSNAVISGTTGLAILGGTANQTLSGKFNISELELNNTLGAATQTGSTISVLNALDLKTGNFNSSLSPVTFLSASSSQVAILDNFSAGNTGTYTGNVIAQRFYDASSTWKQHEIGSPVNAPALSAFGAGSSSGYVLPYSTCDETGLQLSSPYGNVFSMHESNGTTCGLAQWYVESGGTASINGQGYSVLLPGSGTLSVSGTPNNSATYPFSALTNSGWNNNSLENRPMHSGWHLLSNPYLANLNLSGNTSTAMDVQVFVWNTEGTHASSYQPATTIPPFQAFLVHTSTAGNNGTYTINASARTRTAAQQFESQNDNELDITATNLGTGLLDETTVAFNSNATDGFDPQFDWTKMAGSLNRHTFYSLLSDGLWMYRNILNSVSTTGSVSLGFEPGNTNNYSFTFNGISTFDPTTYVMLEDQLLGTMWNVRNGNYNFSSDSSDSWSRFVLHFTPPAVISSTDASCTASGQISVLQPGTADWNYTLTDANNAVISSGVLNQTNPFTANVVAGTYTLTLVDNNNYTAIKVITVGGAQIATAAFTTPTNTVSTQTTVSFTNTSTNATSFNWNFGDGGTVSGIANPTHVYSLPGAYTVSLTVTSAEGCSSTTTHSLTVTANPTSINTVADNKNIEIWGNENKVYVDFSQIQKVDAQISIFNILGQEICNEKYTTNSLYQKEITNLEAAYVIVRVKNGDNITTGKVFIINNK